MTAHPDKWELYNPPTNEDLAEAERRNAEDRETLRKLRAYSKGEDPTKDAGRQEQE